MAENKINLVLIGMDELILKKQLAVLSCSADINSKIVCSDAIIDAMRKHTQDEHCIVIINLSANGLQELQFLDEFDGKKSPVIIIGDKGNVDLLSRAIRAGVKDFIDDKAYEDQLDSVFYRIKENIAHTTSGNNVKCLNVFINAKGGSGASFIASNVAYILAKEASLKVALVDLDMQFGSIGLNFDRVPKYTLTEALAAIDELDSISLEAYMIKYNEKLSLLLPSANEILLPGEVNIPHLKKLLELLQVNYSQIVVDLPRLIDPVSSLIMERSDQIILVLQQSLVEFRDARRLIQILNKDLEIPLEKISLVLNRYDPNHSLRITDLNSMVNHNKVYTITNDFERVVSCSNLGVPLCEYSAKSKIAQDLKELAKNLGKVEFEVLKKKWFSSFNIF